MQTWHIKLILKGLFVALLGTAGVLTIAEALLGREQNPDTPPWVGLLIGLALLTPALWTLGLRRWWTWKYNERWNEAIGGFVFITGGITLMLISVYDDEASFHAPRCVVTAAGVVFLLGGLLIISSKLPQGHPGHPAGLLHMLLVALLITCFGVVSSIIALGIGEGGIMARQVIDGREILILPALKPERLCFLPGALLLDAGAVLLWFRLLKRVLTR